MSSECRICCEEIFTPNPRNIFERRSRRVLQAIKNVTGLSLKFETQLPMHICSCCLLDLSHAMAFRDRCLRTDEKLHRGTDLRQCSAEDPLMKLEAQSELSDEGEGEDEGDEEGDKEPEEPPPRSPPPGPRTSREPKMPRVMIKRLHMGQQKSKPLARAASPEEMQRKRNRRRKQDPNDKRYVCDQCGWSFADLSNMKDHKLRHFEEKFTCDECDRKFYTQPNLKLHIRVIHRGEKPYICKYCGMGFGNSPARCRHERNFHSNKLQFACEVCNKKFNSDKGRLKHQATHQNGTIDTYYCKPCNKMFKGPDCLRRHYQSKYHLKR
ncbi:hypothetical protein KR018_006430, partial [Drosophila ironensis]